MRNEQRPLVSIVTATFNALDGLKATVESVAAQTMPSAEHIIVDGGSSDGTREYLASLGDKVRWVSEPDEGIADAMNKGIAMAQGDWILVLHAEDTFRDDNSLTRITEDLGEFDIASFDVLKTSGKKSETFNSRGFGLKFDFVPTIPHQGAFCRKSLFDRIGRFDESLKIAMDYEWLIRAKRAGASLVSFDRYETIMPATGVSSQVDRSSLQIRLSENRAIQKRHIRGTLPKLLHAIFWKLYPAYKLRGR